MSAIYKILGYRTTSFAKNPCEFEEFLKRRPVSGIADTPAVTRVREYASKHISAIFFSKYLPDA